MSPAGGAVVSQLLGLHHSVETHDDSAADVLTEGERAVAICGTAACFVAAVPAAAVLMLSVLVAWAVCTSTSRASANQLLFAVAGTGTATWGVGLLLAAGYDLLRYRFGRGCVQLMTGFICTGGTPCVMAYFVIG